MATKMKFAASLRGWGGTTARVLLVIGVVLAGFTNAAMATAPAASAAPGEAQAPRHLIMENAGQYAAEARFLLKQGGRNIWLTPDALWMTVPDQVAPIVPASGSAIDRRGHPARSAALTEPARSGTAVRFGFAGANPNPVIEPFGRIETHISYLVGNDPGRWRQDVPAWLGVRYHDLYPGIDLVVGGDATGAVPWRLEGGPGAAAQAFRLKVEGAEVVAAPGALRLQLKGRTLDVALPTWSVAGNPAVASTAGPASDGLVVLSPGSEVAATAALGDLLYSTSFGGSAYDSASAVAVDYLGNAYVAGQTQSSNFPTVPGSYDTSHNGAAGGSDAFVVKYDKTGTQLLYATYLGGTAYDAAWGIAVDGTTAYVVGETDSTDFPIMTGAVVGTDIFVASLSGDGKKLGYVGHLGGDGFDTAVAIAVEGANAYIAGTTYSTNLVGTNCAGSSDGNAVVAKFDAGGVPAYTTCFGGTGRETGSGIAVRGGEAYVTGESLSDDFPGGLVARSGDIIAARVNSGGVLASATLAGGTMEDAGSGIAVDEGGNLYIAGTSWSDDFPLAGGAAAFGGVDDAVILQLTAALAPSFVTYLGGSDEDYGTAIAVDTVGAIYVAGTTMSANFPTTSSAGTKTAPGGFDAYAARLDLASSLPGKLTYATYLGTTLDDWGFALATDSASNLFVAGSGQPTANDTNAFVAGLKTASPPGAPAVTIAGNAGSAVLSWTAVSGAAKYQVFRGAAPYYIPGNGSTLLPAANPALTTFTDSGVLGQVGAYFYVVKAVSAPPEAAGPDSNRAGKFTFELVKGN